MLCVQVPRGSLCWFLDQILLALFLVRLGFGLRCHIGERAEALALHQYAVCAGQGDCPHGAIVREGKLLDGFGKVCLRHGQRKLWVAVGILGSRFVVAAVAGDRVARYVL